MHHYQLLNLPDFFVLTLIWITLVSNYFIYERRVWCTQLKILRRNRVSSIIKLMKSEFLYESDKTGQKKGPNLKDFQERPQNSGKKICRKFNKTTFKF